VSSSSSANPLEEAGEMEPVADLLWVEMDSVNGIHRGSGSFIEEHNCSSCFISREGAIFRYVPDHN
jgi:hypothetical protein